MEGEAGVLVDPFQENRAVREHKPPAAGEPPIMEDPLGLSVPGIQHANLVVAKPENPAWVAG